MDGQKDVIRYVLSTHIKICIVYQHLELTKKLVKKCASMMNNTLHCHTRQIHSLGDVCWAVFS